MATTIGRSTWIDDDGSGTTGTIINNARLQQDIYDRIDALFAAAAGLALAGPITERARAVPMGEWTAIPYVAGNFSAAGSMTWAVEAGDVLINRYTLLGKLLVWMLDVNTTTIGGTVGVQLLVTWPAGVPAAARNQVQSNVWVQNAAQPGKVGMGNVTAPGQLGLFCDPTMGTNWTAGTNNTRIAATILCELA